MRQTPLLVKVPDDRRGVADLESTPALCPTVQNQVPAALDFDGLDFANEITAGVSRERANDSASEIGVEEKRVYEVWVEARDLFSKPE